MIIGVPKEIKLQEHRIGLTPESVKVLTSKQHKVLVQDNEVMKQVLQIMIIKIREQKL